MVGIIPRLIIDVDEVPKLIHDDEDIKKCEGDGNDDGDDDDNYDDGGNEKNDSNAAAANTTTTNLLPSILQQIYLPGFIADPKKVVEKLQQIIVDLPENLRTAPNVIKQIAIELPAHASEIAGNLPSTLSGLHTTIISWGSTAEGVITTSIVTTVNVIKDLPHRATFRWRQLMWVLIIMILCPLLGEVVFFLPMNPVDDGPEENRIFIYGIMTLYQLFMIVPWIETCNFAMPEAKIPVRARIFALTVGLLIAKVIDVILTKGVFIYEPIFPIPFSIFVTGTLGTLPAVPIMYLMTPKPDRERGNFCLMFTHLLAYWVSLMAVIGWAIGIQRLQGNPLQYLVLFSYAILRFICKILICANTAVRLNPKRLIQLNLVVDVLFTRVQIATWPFIDSPFTLLALFASESSVVLWRYYNGVDRIGLWWGAMMTTALSSQEQYDTDSNGNSVGGGGSISKTSRMKGITEACFTGSNQYIINMSLSEDRQDVVRSLTKCNTSSTLDISMIEEEEENGMDLSDNGGNVSKLIDLYFTDTGRGSIETATHRIMMYDDSDDDSSIGIEINNFASIMRGVGDGIATTNDDDDDEYDVESPTNVVNDDDTTISSSMGTMGGRTDGFENTMLDDDNGKEEDIETTTAPNDDNADVDIDGEKKVVTPSTTATKRGKEIWEQRDLYHMVDSTGSLCVNIIVRINQQLIFIAVRNIPSSAQHLNESFQISDERWFEAQIYGSIFIVLMLLLVVGINYSVFFSSKQGLGEGKKLSLGRILSYIFKDHFWYFFFWLISTGALVSSAMVNHFGADFTMNFEYMSCLEQIEWPGCPADDGGA